MTFRMKACIQEELCWVTYWWSVLLKLLVENEPNQQYSTMAPQSLRRWRPDSEASNCQNCDIGFGLFTRRHHCRVCGDIFCADCAREVKLVKPVSNSPQRVCANCACSPVPDPSD